jgi:hypothetical protein
MPSPPHPRLQNRHSRPLAEMRVSTNSCAEPINLGGTPSSPVQAAATAWDNALLAFYSCGPFFILSGTTLTPTATINMTYGAITDPTSSGDDDSVGTSTTTTITRGVTDFIHATTSGGFISTISIQINSMMTASAAIQEVVAHELGHTLNLYDCNYPGCPVNRSPYLAIPTASPHSAVDVRVITALTTQNPLWWAALVLCFVIGFAIARSWSGPLGLWIALLLIASAVGLGCDCGVLNSANGSTCLSAGTTRR